MTSTASIPALGAVAIGRNEGPRLLGCLRSLLAAGVAPSRVAYVDSGSTDGSVSAARALGVIVVELDSSKPFTAARGRNAGMAALLAADPSLAFVQFVDGDCEVSNGWLALAAAELSARPDAGAVCGRRRERFPAASVFNRLCDIEWNTPVGEARDCGGDALVRVAAFAQVGGYDGSIIAAEDTEFCIRLGKAAWKIRRLHADTTLHDANIHRLAQWWRRMVRAGHGFAENAALHGAPPLRHWVKETRSNWFWGLVVPMLALAFAWPTRGWSLLLLAGYGVLAYKIARSARRRGLAAADVRPYAFFGALAKFPLAWGQAKYWLGRLSGRRSRIIEYKAAPLHAAVANL